MSYKFEEGKQNIINTLIERIQTKVKGKEGELLAIFIAQFYGTMALEDIEEWKIDELYGQLLNFWAFIHERKPHETKIKIYNPEFEKHGWQSTHTVVEVICTDAPFLVDSLRLAINREGLSCHLTIHMGGLRASRDNKGIIQTIYPRIGHLHTKDVLVEAPIYMEIDRQTNQAALDALHATLERVLEDNRVVVDDWGKMREKVRESITELNSNYPNIDTNELSETKAFLEWIEDHHFTFLGVRDYEHVKKGKETIIQAIPESGLGLLREKQNKSDVRTISELTPEARELTLSSHILIMSKKPEIITRVHRDADTDYIAIKRFNSKGEVIGERCIIGLYTSAAYNTNPKHIPFLRHKVARILEKSQFNPKGHAGKTLLNILETLPRNDLIQGTEDELLEMSIGIFHMQDRKRLRLFARKDIYGRFVSCLVYVPKDAFNSNLAKNIQTVLSESFNATKISFTTQFYDSVLARIHYLIQINPKESHCYNVKEIEQKLTMIARSWSDDLQLHLIESFGEEQANHLFAQYKSAFPLAYTDTYSPKTAAYDIKHIEKLSKDNPLGIHFYKLMDEPECLYRIKLYQHESTIPLSDVLPILENLGLRAISERPYALKFANNKLTWINDFAIQYTTDTPFDLDAVYSIFEEAFEKLWFGDAENDHFNRLILAAGFTWREVAVLRAYAKYFKQIGFKFSQDYIEKALNNNKHITKKLIQLFELRFNPLKDKTKGALFNALVDEILNDLDAVSNLDEDKIIRQYVEVIKATIRTNYYQQDSQDKNYLSFKLTSSTIPGVPKPHPMFEIFIYSPRFEGVHLRSSKVARGGIRWSDRREDFRTEILGLIKAQQVKNAIIVPSGAKGGFVPKQLPINGSREEIQAEGVYCYQQFIRALLDITDNIVDGAIVKPKNVLCYDEDDPYFVVAADKGTATFSDIANAISLEFNFWLGDAFASGGSVGYDHKKMGITAKGAWESVKRHFFELNKDIQTTDFTVVGIGDMSGDVFGNGMLLSKHIRLLGAFNHLHIFVDPNPDAQISFKERERMFNLPRSSWIDYNADLISKGGGVFSRTAKSIPVSREMRQVFGITAATIEPNELIRAILKAPVDLLWSGGIGTYVKSDSETNADVGDKTNDATRINASELRCKVIGEGGNLGISQRARMEYGVNGGLSYPDFIDNSGGVNCSDKEVNIKILLNSIVNAGDLTPKQRNQLLHEMTEEVSSLVLMDNFAQTRAISLASFQAFNSIDLHARYMNELERTGKLDRALEFLPDNKTLLARKQVGMGLTRAGISVLVCYSKMILKERILASDVPEDPYLKNILVGYFPKPLQERFSDVMENHPLKREIIATKLSNIINNEMGFIFVYRIQDETGVSIATIVRAYMTTRAILNLESIWKQMDSMASIMGAEKYSNMLIRYIRLARRITGWFIRNERKKLDISKAVKRYCPGFIELKNALPGILAPKNRESYNMHYEEQLQAGITKELAHELTITNVLFGAMDILDVAFSRKMSITKVAEVYFAIEERLDLAWIRTQIIQHPSENHWESLSREALRDDLDSQQRQLTAAILSMDTKNKELTKNLSDWSNQHIELINRWQSILTELRSNSTLTYTMFFVAVRELSDLTQSSAQMVKVE